MSKERVPANIVQLEIVSDTERPDSPSDGDLLLEDEDFFNDLIDLINQNFVLEVQACHAGQEEGRPSLNNPTAKV